MSDRSPSRGTRRRARKDRDAREAVLPRASFEELDIRTADGVALRAIVDDPPEGVELRGTCVMAHALFARKSEFGHRSRHGLAQACAAKGWRTIAFDFRGHGESVLPKGAAEWGYDDLVRFDLPAVVDCARARGEDKPVIVLGHSLGGHVALAAQGTGRMAADGIVAVAANVWVRDFETSSLRWGAKRAISRVVREAVTRLGYVPARWLRLGSDDASGRFMRDVLRFTHEDAWRSADGHDDYKESLSRVVVPVCSVASDGDRMTSHPAPTAALVRRCGGPVEVLRVSRGDDGRPAPGHMEIVTTERARSTLLAAIGWVESELAASSERARPRPS